MRVVVCVLMALWLLATGPARAQPDPSPPLSEVGEDLVFNALDHQFILPPPEWLEAETGSLLEGIDVDYEVNSRQALIEMTPIDPVAPDHLAIYAARITLEAERPLREYRRSVMVGYAQLCKPEFTGFFQFGPDDGDVLAPLGFVCGLFTDRLPNLAGFGEVVIMSFKRSEEGIAVVYQEWMGPAFDPANAETWPVPPDTVETRADILKEQARLLHAGD